jgi:hypothetical protein
VVAADDAVEVLVLSSLLALPFYDAMRSLISLMITRVRVSVFDRYALPVRQKGVKLPRFGRHIRACGYAAT